MVIVGYTGYNVIHGYRWLYMVIVGYMWLDGHTWLYTGYSRLCMLIHGYTLL